MTTSFQPKIAYSTLACPDWSLEEAAAAAKRYGYDGLELRLLDGQLLSPDMPDDQRKRVTRVLADAEVELPVVDTSVRLTSDDSTTDDDLARWCDVVAGWKTPMFRVFGGHLPEGLDAEGATARAAERLRRVAPHAEKLAVQIVLETHDAFRSAASVAAILDQVDSPAIGVVWDIANSWQTGDTPPQVWELLGERIAHVHVKDIGPAGDEPRAHVMLGDGQVPTREALAVLAKHGYNGWLSVEWEKKWHPELPEPDVALPHHMTLLRTWLDESEG